MKPTFGDLAGYRHWRDQWRALYRRISASITEQKASVRCLHHAGSPKAPKAHKNLHYERVIARKLMMLLAEANQRRDRIRAMHDQIAAQNARFPLTLNGCRYIDFHYNRIANEFSEMPIWVVKTKGQTFYLRHVTANAPWSTHEKSEGSTKGMMRFRNCSLRIDANGEAAITQQGEMSMGV